MNAHTPIMNIKNKSTEIQIHKGDNTQIQDHVMIFVNFSPMKRTVSSIDSNFIFDSNFILGLVNSLYVFEDMSSLLPEFRKLLILLLVQNNLLCHVILLLDSILNQNENNLRRLA